jgi:hypothetical protein
MFRVNVTMLEKFRRYMDNVSPFDSEEALVECIKGIFEGNAKTSVGQAMHQVLEGKYEILPDRKRKKDLVKAGGIIFSMDQAMPALSYRINHPRISSEISVKQIYQTYYGPIMVTGRVDAIEGIHVRDAKYKFRNINLNDYTESCQWKFYLDMLDCMIFYYDLFEIKGFKENHIFEGFAMDADVKIIAHDPLQCLRYPTMRQELGTLLNDFLDYIDNRNLFGFLKPAKENEPLFR